MPWRLSEMQFQRYKRASHAHGAAGAERAALGNGPVDPTAEDLAAIDEADAALAIARQELDSARDSYLHEPSSTRLPASADAREPQPGA
jgi:hypothetical protein